MEILRQPPKCDNPFTWLRDAKPKKGEDYLVVPSDCYIVDDNLEGALAEAPYNMASPNPESVFGCWVGLHEMVHQLTNQQKDATNRQLLELRRQRPDFKVSNRIGVSYIAATHFKYSKKRPKHLEYLRRGKTKTEHVSRVGLIGFDGVVDDSLKLLKPEFIPPEGETSLELPTEHYKYPEVIYYNCPAYNNWSENHSRLSRLGVYMNAPTIIGRIKKFDDSLSNRIRDMIVCLLIWDSEEKVRTNDVNWTKKFPKIQLVANRAKRIADGDAIDVHADGATHHHGKRKLVKKEAKELAKGQNSFRHWVAGEVGEKWLNILKEVCPAFSIPEFNPEQIHT